MSKRFRFNECPLAGVHTIKRILIEDTRGFFSRFFCTEEFRELGLQRPIAQMNHTLTVSKGAIRGLHYQNPPYAEAKIVNCLSGKVFDVAVDVRRGSPTFLKWHGEILSAENKTGLYIPEGFAHGFQALTENCELLYLHSAFYRSSAENGLNVADPRLGINWPLVLTDCSDRDRNIPMIENFFAGVVI